MRAPHRLEWQGRTWEPGAADRRTPSATVRAAEAYGDSRHRLIAGDALDVARSLYDQGERADLVYLDPPYASQANYTHEARLDGRADGRVRRARAYDDSWPAGAYLDMLAPRLEALTRLLSPRGTIWVHVDWRASYLVRALLDELLGPARFVNEIVWRRAPNLGRQAASAQFGRTLDTIIVYAGGDAARLQPPTRLEPIDPASIRRDEEGRPFTLAPRGDYTDASVARLEKEGRIHRAASGKVYVKYFLVADAEGRLCRERRVDALWTDVAPLRHAATTERTGYPTQKPRALLERIIAASTQPGDTVVDLFCGSGTTGDAAHALGRRAILGDAGPIGLATARARLLRAGAGLSVERHADALEAPPLAVSCRVHATADAVAVELVAPREPLAWVVARAEDAEEPARAIWHAERAPGSRPVPAATRAVLPANTTSFIVRVYGDDGAVGDVGVSREVVRRARAEGKAQLVRARGRGHARAGASA